MKKIVISKTMLKKTGTTSFDLHGNQGYNDKWPSIEGFCGDVAFAYSPYFDDGDIGSDDRSTILEVKLTVFHYLIMTYGRGA